MSKKMHIDLDGCQFLLVTEQRHAGIAVEVEQRETNAHLVWDKNIKVQKNVASLK